MKKHGYRRSRIAETESQKKATADVEDGHKLLRAVKHVAVEDDCKKCTWKGTKACHRVKKLESRPQMIPRSRIGFEWNSHFVSRQKYNTAELEKSRCLESHFRLCNTDLLRASSEDHPARSQVSRLCGEIVPLVLGTDRSDTQQNDEEPINSARHNTSDLTVRKGFPFKVSCSSGLKRRPCSSTKRATA